MIDYATWCAIRDGKAKHLNATQLAEHLALDVRTVRHWMNRPYAPRLSVKRPSKLDPFKGRIVGWLDAFPLSAQQVFQRLCDAGYTGGVSIVKDYVATIRPRHREAFLSLAFAQGDVAQVDWGDAGIISVGNTRRRLSFFVMVLAWSRQMYVEFTLTQTMEQFLSAHINAFNALGVPRRVMVDNLRCAVLRHVRDEPVQFNPRFVDFSRHYGFDIIACAPRQPQQKGRVERNVDYIRRNFLNGLELPDFAAYNPSVKVWLETTANSRLHRETHRRPVDMWAEEREFLKPVNPRLYDVGRVLSVHANSQFRVTLETNKYSVPARLARKIITLKAYPDRVCLYHANELVARHCRSFDRHQDIADADHSKALVTQRRHARDSQVLKRLLDLAPVASTYHAGLLKHRGNALSHVRKIVALAEIHGDDAVTRAITDALAYDAFSSEYIAHIISSRARQLPEPGPLILMRQQDVLSLDLPPADLSVYSAFDTTLEKETHEKTDTDNRTDP
jgi:transposase